MRVEDIFLSHSAELSGEHQSELESGNFLHTLAQRETKNSKASWKSLREWITEDFYI